MSRGRITIRIRRSQVASARNHLIRAQAHALLDELDEAKQQGQVAVRELRTALNGWYGLDAGRQPPRSKATS